MVRRESGLELRRCSFREFDFDVARVLWADSEGEDNVEEVGVALRNELSDTQAREVTLVVHPLNAFSFFTPMSPALSERERMRRVVQQSALLSGSRSADDLRITPHRVRTETLDGGEQVEWIHILALPKAVQARVEGLMSFLPIQDRIRMVSTEAAALVMAVEQAEASGSDSSDTSSYSLAIGRYPAHTEFSLAHRGHWYHGHAVAETGAENGSYFAVGFLNRLGVSVADIRRLFVYGSKRERAGGEAYRSLFGMEPQPLNPFDVFGLSVEDGDEHDASDYVPCVGALLESVGG